MAKETKNVITKEEIKSELLALNRGDLIFHSVLGIVLLLLFLPFNIAIISATWSDSYSVWIKLLSTLLTIIALDALFILDMVVFINVLVEKKKIKKDEFDITVRSLIYKDDTVYRRFKLRRVLKGKISRVPSKNLHFAGFDAEFVDGTTYNLASNGDDFYIVHFKDKNDVELLYPAKIYELK